MDLRAYIVEPGWRPLLNRSDARLFCHHLRIEERYHHRITMGEVFLNRDTDNLCFNCARDRGIISTNRPSLEKGGFPSL